MWRGRTAATRRRWWRAMRFRRRITLLMARRRVVVVVSAGLFVHARTHACDRLLGIWADAWIDQGMRRAISLALESRLPPPTTPIEITKYLGRQRAALVADAWTDALSGACLLVYLKLSDPSQTRKKTWKVGLGLHWARWAHLRRRRFPDWRLFLGLNRLFVSFGTHGSFEVLRRGAGLDWTGLDWTGRDCLNYGLLQGFND
ncbi:hypothetical protein BKA80DRAFT_270317 [Phyllosticta citrichinensis]